MALRVAILAAIALAVFAVLFLRLWSLQVLSGSKYEHAALNNQLRTFPIEAPARPDPRPRRAARSSRTSAATAVEVVAGRPAEAGSLRGDEAALDGPQRAAPQAARKLEQGKNEPADAGDDAGRGPQADQVAYLAEHRPRVPGRPDHASTYLRKYNTAGAARARARLRRRDLSGAARRSRSATRTARPRGRRS